MPGGTAPKEGDCQAWREPPYRACPYGSRDKPHRAAPRAALQAGLGGSRGPHGFIHPSPGGAPAQAPLSPFLGIRGDCTSQSPARGYHSRAPATPSAHLCPRTSPHAPPAFWMEVWYLGRVWDEQDRAAGTQAPLGGLAALCAGCPSPSTATVAFTGYFGQCLREEAWGGREGMPVNGL